MKQKTKKTRIYQKFSAKEKAKAVLSIWSERRKPSEVCRELGVKGTNLTNWQNKALEGMLKELGPRNPKEEEKIPAIGDRLKRLLDRKMSRHGESQSRLQQRLTEIQEKKEVASQQKE